MRIGMAKRVGTELFVSRLSFYSSNQELKELFSPFGLVTKARLVMDQSTKRPKGFGFVTLESEIEAQNAVKALNGKIVNGRLIFVEMAQNPTKPGDANSKKL